MIEASIIAGAAGLGREGLDRGGRAGRRQRIAIAFGLDGSGWNEELALQRYELLYEAGLVAEAQRAREAAGGAVIAGRAMVCDHRRILATAIARLRAKIKYRPVVFELMPPTFTLLQLQRGRRGARRPPGAQAELPPARRAAGSR